MGTEKVEKYEGTILNGIHVTGSLAAAHLGAGSVKSILKQASVILEMHTELQ
jgi:hypothetical protein